jgi:hypothetical protein
MRSVVDRNVVMRRIVYLDDTVTINWKIEITYDSAHVILCT